MRPTTNLNANGDEMTVMTAEGFIGSRCPTCERAYFPSRALCPRCYHEDLPAAEVPSRGTLATWTVVRMSGSSQVPYALGYVDFPGDVRVLGQITNWVDGMRLGPGLRVTASVRNTDVDGKKLTESYEFTINPRDLEV